MPNPRFYHEKLDVYRLSLDLVAWTVCTVGDLQGIAKHARDQLIRSTQSIPQNIAEGNGKRPGADRRRYLEIARGSVTESAATLDVLVAMGAKSEEEIDEGKTMLVRLSQMLTKMAPPEASPSSSSSASAADQRKDKRPVFRAGRRFPSGGRRAG